MTAAHCGGYFEEQHRSWRTWAPRLGSGLFDLPVAPDKFHKANVSGGEPYGLIVPDGCADALFTGQPTMQFVSYLNWVFSNGGFPRPTGDTIEWRIKQALATDLLPL